MNNSDGPLVEFLEAACVPLEGTHASGTLDRANLLLAAHPEIATSGIHAAAILGDDAAVRQCLAIDPAAAAERVGPRAWDPLTCLCFSRYLRLDPSRSAGMVRAAEALLDAGADANGGWYEENHLPEPAWESVLYGAAGIAHHAELTRLLIQRGANPNDGETPYHAPEGWDNAALQAVVESGRVTADSLAIMLVRKADWHDPEGMRMLLEHGADPNFKTRWGRTALHQAVIRDNALENIELLLDHGADPLLDSHGQSSIQLAARRGRGDALRLFDRRGFRIALPAFEQLIAACALNDETAARSVAQDNPQLLDELRSQGGKLLADFAGNGNTGGVELLLSLGVDIATVFAEGDGYFGIARNSTALHVAAWRARHDTTRFLIQQGASVNVLDAAGRSPLTLAIRACVDSYWTSRRSPASVEALLAAGAKVRDGDYPSGYNEVDELVQAHA